MNQAVVRVAFHPLAWDRIRPILEAQGLDPVKINGQLMVTPTVQLERQWRESEVLAEISEADLLIEFVEHVGMRSHEKPAGVRIRHVPSQIVVESRNHDKLLRNQRDALHILAGALLKIKEEPL